MKGQKINDLATYFIDMQEIGRCQYQMALVISSFVNKRTDLMEKEERLNKKNLTFTSIIDGSTLLSHNKTQT